MLSMSTSTFIKVSFSRSAVCNVHKMHVDKVYYKKDTDNDHDNIHLKISLLQRERTLQILQSKTYESVHCAQCPSVLYLCFENYRKAQVTITITHILYILRCSFILKNKSDVM